MLSKLRRPQPGVVIGTVALVFAMGGAAVALPGKNTVDSGDIKNKQVKTADLNKKTVAPKVKSFTAFDEQYAANGNLPTQATNEVVLERSLPAGKYLVTGKLNLFINNAGAQDFTCGVGTDDDMVDEARINLSSVNAETRPITSVGVVKVAAGDSVQLLCGTSDTVSNATDIQLVAIPTK